MSVWLSHWVTEWQEALQTIDRMVYFVLLKLIHFNIYCLQGPQEKYESKEQGIVQSNDEYNWWIWSWKKSHNIHKSFENKALPVWMGHGDGPKQVYTYCNIYVILFLTNIISRNWGCSRNEKCAWKNISDISQTCKHNFPGEEEFSEPETRAVRVGILYSEVYDLHCFSWRNF